MAIGKKAHSPFDDDDDDPTVDELIERDAKKVRAAGKKEPVDQSAKDDEPVKEYSLEEPEADDGPQHSVHREKKQNRFREQQERAAAAEARTKELELEVERERVQRTTIETNYRLEQDRQTREKEQGPSKLDQEAKSLWDENNRILQQYNAEAKAGTLTEEKADQLRERSRQIAERRMEIVVERREAARPEPRRESSQNPMEAQVRGHLSLHHPDIVANERAHMYMVHEHNRLVLLGEPDSLRTLEKAVDNTRRDMGLGGARPSKAQQRRASGVSASGGGSLGSAGESRGRSMVPTEAQKRMAVATYPGLPREKAIQRWVSTVGKKLVEEQEGGAEA